MTAPVFTSVTPSWLNVTQEPDMNQTCEESEDFKYLAYKVTYSVVFPIGFISNSVALFVFLRLTPKKTANTVFMTNLAISDVGFSLTLPFRLVYYFRGGLSVLRYIAVVHPIRNKSLVTVWRARLSCFAIWVFVACSSIPFLMTGTTERHNKMRCFEPGNNKSWNRIYSLNYVGVSFGFVIPFIIILVCYGCIICKLIKGRKIGNRRGNTRRRSVYLIAVVLSTFLLCFLPYHVARTVHLYAKVLNESCPVIEFLVKILVISLCMAASNSCFNPLLYYFAGETFRTAIRRVSDRRTLGSFSHSGVYPSFRRRSSSQKSRHQGFTSVRQDCLPCSCQVINEKKPDGCKSDKQCKRSDSEEKQVHYDLQ
ncbi:cysteinyl leukotriene receptor 2-like [Sinocyclocheilus anshuiensis]|uniref:cysteinyl leukotriene receptor 2-like n=1 Tax=Sinocyclocheilus anshuiensis TaxID=1608454 RepID=UPI0007B8C235|nr:PREDICTED: cysteinyl leukotriene receptor 2-like [Sinocyclocheilus anshuiensis]